MERQSTSKLFKIVIAIVAFFVLCSSALLFASCGVSKDDGHEHKYPDTPNATVPATCGTPGYIVYECTECGEQFKVEISLATGKHTFNENDVCTNCGMTKTQADLLTQAAFKSAIDDLKNTLGTLATGAQLQGLNDLSQAQVKTLTDALETALKTAITNAQTAITDAVGGSTSGTSSAKTEILQAIQDALEDINGEDATSVQSVLKAEIAKQTAKIEEYNTDLKNLKTALEAAQGEAKDAIIEEINKTNEAIESAKDAIVAAVSVAQTSIEKKLGDLDEKVGTAQTTLSGEIGNVKTVVDGIQEALKALDNLAKTTDVAEVKTLVEEIKTTLTTTITGRFDSIDSAIAALTNSESGIAASVKSNTQTQLDALKSELKTLIETGTSDDKFDEVVSQITQKITDAFNSFKQTLETTLDDKLEGILTQSHFDTELQKVTATLGEIKTKVNEALDKKLSEVEGSIGTAQKAILDAIAKMAGSEEEGEGPVLPTIKGWVQEILYAITGDSQYAPAAAASLMSESVKPEGMQKQIADLWDKADELQDALATLSESLTTLSGSVSNLPNKTEVQGYITALQEELKGKQDTYNTNLTTLNGTLSSVSTKVDNVQSYLEDTLYKQLETMDGKLDELVSHMGEFYTLFTKLRTYAQKHYADLGGSTWEEVFDNVLSTFGGYFQQLPSYLNKLKGWDDIIDKIVEFAKAQGVVNEDGTLGTNFNKAIDTVKALWDFLGVSEQLDDNGNYKNDGAITTVATLVGMLDGLQTTADDIKSAVDGLVTKFDSLDVSALMQAVKAFNGSTEAGEKVKGVVELLKDLPEEIKSAFINALSSADIKNAVKGLLETYFPGHTASELKVLAQDYVEIAEELRDIWKAFGDNAGDNLKTLVQWAATNYVNGNMSALLDSAKGLQQLVDSNNGIQATVKAFEESMNKTLGTFAEGQSVQSMLDDILDKLGNLGTAQGAHQHHWVKTLGQEKDGVWTKAENQTPNCLTSNTYVWYCYVCGECEKKGKEVITEVVLPTGHVTDWTHFDAETPTFGEGDELETTYYAPTCVNPGRVEGYCVVCGQPTGEWTTVGAPTGIHNYVLEDGTDAEGNSGTKHECTSIHEYVYHCTTCGGAYTEQVNTPGSIGPDGKVTFHNYYSQLDEETKKPTGKPLTDAEKAKLYADYVEAHKSEDLAVETLTPQQKYEALEAYLNKVWDSPATCVEPALTVVECVDCGVRYAYANGTPNGHDFKLYLGTEATCTKDGNSSYAYCPDCGYYFAIPDTVAISTISFSAPTFSEGKYHYDGKDITEELAKWLNDNAYSKEYAHDGDITFKGADNADAHAYFTGKKVARGHEYVVVYTNISNCVTAQTYMLVCKTCFKDGDKSFKDLVEVEGTPNPDALFYQEAAEEGVVGKYWVKGLGGDQNLGNGPVIDAATVKAVVDKATTDPATDLLKQAQDLADANKVDELAQWIIDHKYGVRAEDKSLTKDDLTGKTAEELLAIVTANNKNILTSDEYILPVTGHTFTEKVTTVIGVCVMYPRHQYFCTVCGEKAVDPELPAGKDAKVPFFVSPDEDSYVAGYKNEQNPVPEGFKTDLEKDWDKKYQNGDGKVDDIIDWLGQYGYINDYRTVALTTPWDSETELTDVKASLEKAADWKGEDLGAEFLAKFFTKTNCLVEFVEDHDEEGALKTIGHTFNLAIQLGAESCNEPGRYVYICSVCGMVEAWGKGDSSDHATGTKQPSWWLGQDKVDDLLSKLDYLTYQMGDELVTTNVLLLANALDDSEWKDGSNYYYLYDEALDGSNGRMNANIPTGRKDITDSDLELSWKAAQADTANEDAIFDWLLEHGYFNNVIDTVIEMARADLAKANTYNLSKKAAEEPDWADYYKYSAQNIYDLAYAWWNGTDTIALVKNGEPVNVLEKMAEIFNATGETEIEADDLQLDEEKQKAIIKLVLEGGPVTGTEETVEPLWEGELSVFYTKEDQEEYGWSANKPSNSALEAVPTPIPVSGHLYTKEDGTPLDTANDPLCEGYASDVLKKDFYDQNKVAYWDKAAKAWKEVEGVTLDKSKIPQEIKDQIEKYGIIAACKRENCPLHKEYNEEDYGEGKEPYTGGYVPAQPHEMSYEKNRALTPAEAEAQGWTPPKVNVASDRTGKPSDYVEGEGKSAVEGEEDDYIEPKNRTHYNMNKVADYLPEGKVMSWTPSTNWDEVSVATSSEMAAAYKAMDEDLLNLYTLQKIYNYQNLYLPMVKQDGEATAKAFFDKHKELELPSEATIAYITTGEKAGYEQTWMPLTRASETSNVYDTPSCWVNLRCKWYDGEHCKRKEATTSHTLPKGFDWNYNDNRANCQHGDLCIACGWDMNHPIEHALVNVTTLTGNQLKYWKALFKEHYTGSHFGVEGDDSTAWNEIEEKFLTATCCDEGHEIYICLGELEVYGKTGVFNAVEEETDIKQSKYDNNAWVGATNEKATYFVKTVEPTGVHKCKLYQFAADTEVFTPDNALTETQWNGGFNDIVCQKGYVEKWICENEHRDPEDGKCLYIDESQTVTHEAPGHIFAPVTEYWKLSRYLPAQNGHNATVQHVCTVCGVTMYGVYGDTTGSQSDLHQQYVMADASDITRWNDKRPENLRQKFDAYENIVRTDDVVENSEVPTPGASGVDVLNGVNVFKTDETITSEAGYAVNVGKDGGSAVIGKNATLTFSTTDNKSVYLDGEFSFIGEDPNSSKVKFESIDRLLVDTDANVSFENVTVELGEYGLENFSNRGVSLTFKNCIIKAKDTPFWMNASWGFGSEVTIENCYFISEEDVGFAIWDSKAVVHAKDSVFFGKKAGAFVRSGEAIFTDCQFYTTNEDTGVSGSWGQATNVPIHAAFAAGSGSAGYGAAVVTLKNCNFGTWDKVGVDTAAQNHFEGFALADEQGPCSDKIPAIAAYSINSVAEENNDTTSLHIDAKTAINMQGFIDTDSAYEDTLNVDYPAPSAEDLGTGEEQAQNAAKLVESLVAAGAEVTLPKIDGTIDIANFVTPKDSTAAVNLNGNTMNFTATEHSNSVDGDLTITGGTLNIERPTSDTSSKSVAGLAVDGKLTLDNVTVVANSGILPCNGGELVIEHSFIRSNKGFGITTNNTLDEPPVTITITNSTIASMDQSNGVGNGNEGNVGLLINEERVTLTATGSTFYGVCTGAWVRAGKADFTDCKFITGSALIGSDWSSGNTSPKEAKAALLIGNGGYSTNYQKATVTLTNCTGIVSKEAVVQKDGKWVAGEGNKVTVNEAAAMNAKIDAEEVTAGGENAKKIVLAAYKTGMTTLTIKDEATAKAFFGTNEDGTVKNPVIGTDVILGEGANNASVIIKYTKTVEGEDVETELLPATILAAGQELNTKASEALTEAATNGGKVVLPEGEEAQDVTVNQKVFQVGEDKALEVDLNGNNLKLTGDGTYSAILAKEGGEVTINGNGGTLEVTDSSKAPIGANGEGSKLTIKNTTLKTNVGLQGENGATVVLEDTTLISSSAMAISTNNTLQPVHYEIRRCKIASYPVGNVALLINGDRVTLEAEDTEFYGTCTGVWVRATEKATFTRCTFISGSAVTSNQTWGQGTFNPADAKAALLIGDGAGNYGDVKDVTIGEGCKAVITYEWYSDRGQTTHNDTAITSAENDLIAEKEGWFEFTPYTGDFKNKVLVIAESGTQKANVKFANAEVAKEFGIEGQDSLVKGTNVYLEKSATATQIVVTIGDADPFSPKAE